MILEFPQRVWTKTAKGWTSAEPTQDDHDRRKRVTGAWQVWAIDRPVYVPDKHAKDWDRLTKYIMANEV